VTGSRSHSKSPNHHVHAWCPSLGFRNASYVFDARVRVESARFFQFGSAIVVQTCAIGDLETRACPK
jgi:hypothetical protein